MPVRSACRVAATALTCLLGSTSAALAQNAGTATLRGVVQDASGGVLPGAVVLLVNEATGDPRRTVADGQGGYIFSSVFAGRYILRVEHPGFSAFERRDIVLSAGDARGLNVTLTLGQQTETMTVVGAPEMIPTQTGAREGVVTDRQLDNLSVIGRSALELLRILPGVAPPEPHTLESVSFLGGGNFTQAYTVNGVRSSNNVVQLDGTNLIDIGSNNGLMLSLNNDMLQEVKVQTSNYAAEWGGAGVQVNAITKAGGAQVRGMLYDYVRDWRLSGNDRSNAIAGVRKPRSEYQYPGGNIGGPVLIPGVPFNRDRKRLFFFLGAEVQRQKIDPGASFFVVPTERQRLGDFSENLAGVGQNLNQPPIVRIPGGYPNTGQPAPNNDLSPYVDPIGRALMHLYPRPNYVDPDNRFNYVHSALEPLDRLELALRLDYVLSDATRAYVRLARQSELRKPPRGFWTGGQDRLVPLPTSGRENYRSHGVSANLVSVVSPTVTNELLVSYAKLKLDVGYDDPSRMTKAALGLPEIGFFGEQSPYAPSIFGSWSGGQTGDIWSPGVEMFAHNDTLQIADKVTKVWKAHALKFGAAVERVNKWQNFPNSAGGLIVLAGAWTPGGTGNDIANLLVGRPATFTQGTRVPHGHFRLWNVDAFAQDSWRLRPNLTFEYGVRVAYMPNNQEMNDLGAIFLPEFYDRTAGAFPGGDTTRVNGMRYVGRGEVPRRLTDHRRPYWMPRVNVAWDVTNDGTHVVRGGYGLFVNRPMGNTVYDVLGVPPNAYSASVDAFQGLGLGQGRGLTYETIREIDPFSRLVFTDIYSVSPFSIHFPITHSMSVSYARRILAGQVLEAGYAGTQGRHLVNRRNVNFIPAGTLSSGTIGNADLSNPLHRSALAPPLVNGLRPFPAFGGVHYYEYSGVSHYHGLQVTLSRGASRRLQYLVSYTRSRATGTQGEDYTALNSIDPAQQHGVLPTDRRHLLAASYNWFLPELTARAPRLIKAITNGWQLSGISSFASGLPIRLHFSGDIATAEMIAAWFGTPSHSNGPGQPGIVPVYLSDPRVRGAPNAGDKLLNVTAIGIPAFGENGPPQPPYDLRTPAYWNHDLTLFKNIRLRGEQKLQLRVGVFNLLNHAYTSRWFGQEIDLALETRCNVRVNGAPNGLGGHVDNVCDPTGGFSFTPQTLENFGKIRLLRGRRQVEIAVKYYF